VITVEKKYGDVTLTAQGGSAAEVIAGLDDEAQRAGLLTADASAKPATRGRGRPSKAEKEAAAVVEAAKLQQPPAAAQFPPPGAAGVGAYAPSVPHADPNPGNVVDPAWLTQQAQQSAAAQLPSFPGATPPLPVAPPPGQPVSPMPAFPGAPIPQAAPFDPPHSADAQTSGWANYVEQQIENYRAVNPGAAEGVLIGVLSQVFGHAPPDFQTARTWLHKTASTTLQGVVRTVGERIAPPQS
jgi:hypothetical protein